MNLRTRIIRATLWTIIIILLTILWYFAAGCDMPGTC